MGIEKRLQDYAAHSFLSLDPFFGLSILLAEMVDHEHQQNVVIGFLSPANIYISRNGQSARLTSSPEHNEAYRSPEQSGKINRVPDERSDLYALGVILYELLARQLPLQPEDGEAWDTVHIYRSPASLADIHPEAAGMPEAIIMKLLAKAPEDRYQSAYGLLEDLRECERIGQEGWQQPLSLGRRDRLRSLQLADSWHGHRAAMEQLTSGLEQAIQGGQANRWVIGAAGMGKTTLVHRLQWKVVRCGGWFIEGSGTMRPAQQHGTAQSMVMRQPAMQAASIYEPVLQALRQGIEQLWSEPAEVVALLQTRLQAAYNRDEAYAMASLLPEAAPLLGVRSTGAETDLVTEASHSATDAQSTGPSAYDELAGNGVATAGNDGAAADDSHVAPLLAELIRCLAASKPPLVLFVDALEQSDTGTHEVLRLLTTGVEIPGLLLIGACRAEIGHDNEPLFDEGFPCSWLSDRWDTQPLEWVALPPLGYEEFRQAMADAMSEAPARLSLLAQAIHERTAGNPQAVHSLLEMWLQDERITFDEQRHRWVWDQELIGHMNDSELQRQLIEESFAELSRETKSLLAIAAVIGLTFQPSFLVQVCGWRLEQVISMLHEAEAQGIVFAEGEIQSGHAEDSRYSFQSNVVHQAMYSAGGQHNAHWHRQIGLMLQRRQGTEVLGIEARAAIPWDAIDHLNLATEAMSAHEVLPLAESNLNAGRQATMDGRFAKAKQYVEAGLKLMKRQEISGTQARSLYVQFMLVLAWAEYMMGNMEQALKLLHDLKEQGRELDKADRTQIWAALIRFHTTKDNKAAIQYGKEALTEYDWKLNEQPAKLSLLKEVAHTRLMLYQYRNKIEHMPINRDGEYAALCGLMEQLFFSLLISNAEAFIELYARFIRYGLRKGMNEVLACIIGSYEQILCRVIPHYTPAIPFTALASLQHLDGIRPSFVHQIEFIGALSKQMNDPREASVHIVKSMRRGLELNDNDFANLAMLTFLVTYSGDVQALWHVLDFYDSHMRRVTSDTLLQLVEATRRYAQALQDESDLRRFIAIPEPDRRDSALNDEDNYSCGCKLETAFLSGYYREALYWAERGRETELKADWIRTRKQRFYEMLTLAALYPERSAAEQKRIGKELRGQLDKMKGWKGYLGYNSAAYLLLMAEWKRITAPPMDALTEYMAAIKQARHEQYGLMEGIACERLALCYRHDLVSRSGAMIAMMDACTAYSLWGISLKATQIREQHPDLLRPMSRLYGDYILEGKPADEHALSLLPGQDIVEEMQTSAGAGQEGRNAEPVWQIIDEIGKLEQHNWKESLLEATLRQSGADRAIVLRNTEDGFKLEAQLDMTAQQASDRLSARPYADSVLRHTAVTNKAIVLDDVLQSYFLKDAYIQARRPRSILCMPIAIPGEQSVVLLYMENGSIPGVFTEQDIKIVELIAARVIYGMLLEKKAQETPDEAAAAIEQQPEQQILIEPLTGRELEILAALAEGLSNRDIAERFGIAETTVKTHATRIFGKLGVKRRGQAVAKAKAMQLFD
ncbi:LuxR C-terminal-related transcriptional regulator [Paenibacillus sp. J5C_2022]|uniref:LuxR C-terminal-related transcriptional regulator n=1 Tax=Paenibacillus sp. J5C2022 TaxID=2977129 RepID=UPI0021CE6AC5|nr:LuxR C-terminal-related transcriptional regulator [Paenibacillus sp. J5C2022]MCU6708856.1 LuxR C-terminal-related transcriptional regulator [Paenibacillus sp. J5C2022]